MHRAPAAKIARPEPQDITVNVPRDPNTLSNYHNFKTTHTAVHFVIDFDKKRLYGTVILSLQSLTEAETSDIILDTSYLDVKDVRIDGKTTEWSLGSRFEPYGSPLSVKLDHGIKKGDDVQLDISVSTTDECTALQWLTPEQTSNKKHPYMFSQCQAIHARSLFPCQDTPDVKSTIDFHLTSTLPVLASGLIQDTGPSTTGKAHTYIFKQLVPIPSYLFAIASGDLVSAPIGPRSTVWTGPDELAACKWEFEADTERYIQIAEKLVYPYAWGTYNLLVLPPSFPYGGMENPIYTFLTPTTVSGDRQNVDVVAHELSHSWSGNLVSAASWEHFWLNEGWTVYLERRLQAAAHGAVYRDFSAIIGWAALEEAVKGFGDDHEFTKLVIDLKGKDPDDAFSTVPYEKGYTFLSALEKLLGTEKWDKFIPHYFTTFKYKSLDSYDFKATLLAFFAHDDAASAALTALDWDGWFYHPGLPPKPAFDTTLADACYALAAKWETLTTDTGPSSSSTVAFQPHASDIADFAGNQLVVLLELIQAFASRLPASATRAMDAAYALSSRGNVEVSFRFLLVGMLARDAGVYAAAAALLGRVGRMKMVRPLYRGLVRCDRALALETFERNRAFYHPICRDMVAKDLYGKGSAR